jgi:hypothetical protein
MIERRSRGKEMESLGPEEEDQEMINIRYHTNTRQIQSLFRNGKMNIRMIRLIVLPKFLKIPNLVSKQILPSKKVKLQLKEFTINLTLLRLSKIKNNRIRYRIRY